MIYFLGHFSIGQIIFFIFQVGHCICNLTNLRLRLRLIQHKLFAKLASRNNYLLPGF